MKYKCPCGGTLTYWGEDQYGNKVWECNRCDNVKIKEKKNKC